MQFTDGQGLVHIIAGAGLLAGMMADPSTDAGKRVVIPEQFQRLAVLSFIDQGNVALDAYMRRAGGFAGGSASFTDGKSPGNRLGILLVNRFAFRKALIELIGQLDRTDFLAFTAAGAFCQVDQTRLLPYRSGEVSGMAFEIQEFGGRQ